MLFWRLGGIERILRHFMTLAEFRAPFRLIVTWLRRYLCCLLLLAGCATPAIAQQSLTPEQEKQFGDYIREYLIKNPEVILEALQELERRRAAEKNAQITNFINRSREELFHAKSSPVSGNPDGDVTIVEFFDYNCPYCRTVTPRIFSLLERDKKARFVYKEFPILGPSSVFAAKAALAVARQDTKLYERFHVALLQVRGRLSESSILATAKKTGVDIDRMKSDMAAPEIQHEIDRNKVLANHLGITGTPAFVIGTKVLNGLQPGAALQAAVDAARREQATAKPAN